MRAALDAFQISSAALPFGGGSGGSGDWHDVITGPTGDLAVVVGDAVGRGPTAAPLKRALRAVAREHTRAGTPPTALLSHLRSMLDAMDGAFATVVLAHLAPATGDVLLTHAGHPPALVVDRGGAARFVEHHPQPPLGAPSAGALPPPTRAHLEPGDTLVLYTDGLVEGRDLDIAQGLDRLVDAAAGCCTAPVTELCTRLLALGSCEGTPGDDLTVVAVRR
jgi:serine phosphatase RsbU (regulator of sigma subunit)